jgi:hypothetical protein
MYEASVVLPLPGTPEREIRSRVLGGIVSWRSFGRGKWCELWVRRGSKGRERGRGEREEGGEREERGGGTY